mmetsp:Transcript_33009/g.68757  ORF Transcript_33009/g.68757 Transcript_33009/m.68757 type:complete len:219 (+) Transcript_33009:356-1012(+)
MRRMPTRTGIGLTIDVILRTGTIARRTTRFLFDQIMQQPFQFLSGLLGGGQGVSFPQFVRQHFEIQTFVRRFFARVGWRNVNRHFPTRTASGILLRSLIANGFQFIPHVMHRVFRKDSIVSFFRSQNFGMTTGTAGAVGAMFVGRRPGSGTFATLWRIGFALLLFLVVFGRIAILLFLFFLFLQATFLFQLTIPSILQNILHIQGFSQQQGHSFSFNQ